MSALFRSPSRLIPLPAALLAWVALAAPSAAQAIGCEELRQSIADKLARGGLPQAPIAIVDAASLRGGRVLGSCENGTRRLVLQTTEPGQTAALPTSASTALNRPRASEPASMRKPVRKDDVMLVECFDGERYLDGPCRR
ncbi:DUF1161 domain-containing protein [Aquabacterium sp. OR-4]|uniref:DUF1161 domain-containing protein n=1 Tax=Aquabacterium sp. OR-4 TaxID=2978127 RepID=UPI0021B34DEC|nr:DUF1161 domain-containing protein [Aquabacterium sp. OR-4]MDT7838054.1 DUF1161 domain-containing protein [Aquabacterium sp. OR-4]